MAEVDARRLYAPAGYTSMHAYCVEKLGLSDDATWKRLQVAKRARQFPVLYVALKEGRVHLTGLNLLAPYLTADNVDELVAAAGGLRKSEIEVLVARRFPRVEALRLDEGISALANAPAPAQGAPSPAVPSSVPAPAQVAVRPRVAPIDGRRFSLAVTIEQATHDKLRRAQDLLGRAGDVAGVLDRALEALLEKLEKRKFAKTVKPRRPRAARAARTIPAHVRRAVLERDGGRCTFVGEDGHRCEARRFLEFDHVVPVARGGVATVDQVRTLCRTHNQLEAERVFGREFMESRRRAITAVHESDLRRRRSVPNNTVGGR
jgi:5-methylcytosine-specific restriction endonuclease McrA